MPITIRTGCRDTQGRLVLIDDELVAVLVRLDDEVHGEARGRWFLEAGFGPVGRAASPDLFDTLDAADAWMQQRIQG